jgi:SAM-dependent methyltransferase
MRLSIAAPLLRGRVLDYGCASGGLCAYGDSIDYVGVDIDRAALSAAKKKCPGGRFYHADEFEPPDGSFDTIALMATIAVIDDKSALLSKLGRWLSNDGRIILTTPHPGINTIHRLGVKLGFFANDHHAERDQVDFEKVRVLAEIAGLNIAAYRRFMLGTNQLFILTKPSKSSALGAGEER